MLPLKLDVLIKHGIAGSQNVLIYSVAPTHYDTTELFPFRNISLCFHCVYMCVSFSVIFAKSLPQTSGLT